MLSSEYKQLRQDGVKDMHNMELIKACKENKDLLGEFLRANKDFVFSIIIHFKGSIDELRYKFRISEEELLQHAYIGILSALKEFDFNKGIKFTTYVVRPILWEINQLLYSDSQAVRLSRGAVELIKRMVEIEDTLGYRPNEIEMSELLGIAVERYREIARFSDELEHYDALEEFELEDRPEQSLEQKALDKVYVQQLLNDPIFTDFERHVMRLIMEEVSNTQIAERLGVYPMTINRTLNRIRGKIEDKEANVKEDKGKVISKYEKEINVIAQEIKERDELVGIEGIIELLEVCGYDTNQYTTRILYYIRQKAIQKLGLL